LHTITLTLEIRPRIPYEHLLQRKTIVIRQEEKTTTTWSTWSQIWFSFSQPSQSHWLIPVSSGTQEDRIYSLSVSYTSIVR